MHDAQSQSINTHARRFGKHGLAIAVATSAVTPTGWAATTTSDPYVDPIIFEGAVLKAVEVATVPTFGGVAARMNRLNSPYDGSGRVFINDQRGQLYVVSPDATGTPPQAQLFMDLNNIPDYNARLALSFESGFQTFTFHPEFATNGKFYTFHTSRRNNNPAPDFTVTGNDLFHIVINEWTDPTPANNIYDGGTPREVLRVGNPGDGHFGGAMVFNRTAAPGDADYGLLYITLGDAGFPGDRFDTSQDNAVLNASILCIDPSGTNGVNGQYGIPSDNPFATTGGQLPEVYATGIRNTQSLSFDSAGDHAGYFADIGSGVIEELNLLTAGANYGWSNREGEFGFVSPPGRDVPGVVELTPTPTGFTDPIAAYDHSEGRAIAGGYVVRDPSLPIDGHYLFGDLFEGRLFATELDPLPTGGQDSIQEVFIIDENGAAPGSLLDLMQQQNPELTRADLRFGTDEFNRYYLINKQDNVVRLLTAAVLAGDYNGSGQVEQGDLNLVLNNWGAPSSPTPSGWTQDFPEGTIDQSELNGVLNNWGAASAPSFSDSPTGLVPEPGLAGLLLLGAMVKRPRCSANEIRAIKRRFPGSL